MFRRKLSALKYDEENDFDAKDETKVRTLVIWLEKMKIRQYKPEDRGEFTTAALPAWREHYSKYLHDAGCPFETDETLDCLDWLLGYAIRLEYSDNAQDFSDVSTDDAQGTPSDSDMFAEIPYDSPQFSDGINKLAALVNIKPHPDDAKVTLRALAKYANEYLSPEARKKEAKKGKPLELSQVNLGFDVKDQAVDEAAKILRLLFLEDIRDLQTRINEAIVAVQALTADPRTDSNLSRVGRR